jgi:hypothetical protein
MTRHAVARRRAIMVAAQPEVHPTAAYAASSHADERGSRE